MGTFQNIQRENEQQSQMLIQPSLEIGKEDDEHEVEANTVADKVMKMSDTEDEEKIMKKSSSKVQMKSSTEIGAMKTSDLGEQENKIKKTPSKIQMMSDTNIGTMQESLIKIRMQADSSTGGMMASKNVEQSINNSKGGGKTLSPDLQDEMGNKMNADLSGVKIHTDENAVQMNKEVGAKAFTHGNDIYFNKNQYKPESSQGKHLLAHELTHTIQQGGKVKRKIQRQEKKVEHDPSRDGNYDRAVTWYLPFGDRIAQWGYNTNWTYTNIDKTTQKDYLGPWSRNALDNGLFAAVQGLLTELVLKRLGLGGMKSRAAGAGVAIATGAEGLEIKERIRCKTIDSYTWYGRYRYNYWDEKVLAVEFWEKGPSFKNMVKPVVLEQCIMNAKGEVLFTYPCELDVLGVNPDEADYMPTYSYGKVD